MASPLQAPDDSPLAAQPCGVHSGTSFGPAMTRCECAGVTFEEVARRMHAERVGAEQVLRRRGCGLNCGACMPDLHKFLASR
jgi:bacterioferritin-associated ferredoxin